MSYETTSMRSNQPEQGVLVPVDAIFPELRADEATLVGLLQRLLTRAFKTKVWELSVIYSHA
jgi:hypothetical protein